jgi:hypothetical protein
MVANADDRPALPTWARDCRDFPGWVSDHQVLLSVQTWMTVGPALAVLIVVAAAGPHVLFPAAVSATTLLLWLLIGAAAAGHLAVSLLRARWRRDARRGSVDSLSRAMSMAEDMLLVASLRTEALWCSMAVMPLAALLYTASPLGNGPGWAWLAGLTGPLRDEHSAAGWCAAAAAVGEVDPTLSHWISDIAMWEGRQRASVGVVIGAAVANHVGTLR